MGTNRNSFELFSSSNGVAGTPHRLDPASFTGMGALELQDIERWIRERPLLLGEDLKIITHQDRKGKVGTLATGTRPCPSTRRLRRHMSPKPPESPTTGRVGSCKASASSRGTCG
jgi:hypothetical protein